MHVSAPKRCRETRKEVTLQHGPNKVNLEEGENFTVDNLNFEVESILATVTPGEDGCTVTNKKVKLIQYTPIVEEISLDLGENQTVGDLQLILEDANIDVSKDENTKECRVGDEEVQIRMVLDGTDVEKSANEGDEYSIGDYVVLSLIHI